MLHSTNTKGQPDFFSRQIRAARRFYLDAAPVPELPLAVVCGGYEFCAAGYEIHRTTFPYYSMEFVTRGCGSLTLNGKQQPLRPGTVFTYGPNVAHHITTDSHNRLEKYFLDFTGVRAPLLLAQHGLPPGSFAHISAIGDIQNVFDQLIRDGLRGTGLSNALCAVLTEYLVGKIADLLQFAEMRESPAYATFQRCRSHITTHFRRLKSLEEIAGECKLDPAYLCRLFRRFERQGPYRFLLRLKMNWAAGQLQDPKLLMREVATKVGFRDPFHFSHAFKNVFGVSPDAFRRLR